MYSHLSNPIVYQHQVYVMLLHYDAELGMWRLYLSDQQVGGVGRNYSLVPSLLKIPHLSFPVFWIGVPLSQMIPVIWAWMLYAQSAVSRESLRIEHGQRGSNNRRHFPLPSRCLKP